MMEDLTVETLPAEFEITSEDGEFCASTNDYDEAMHYAFVYSQDHPVLVVRVLREVWARFDRRDK